MYVTVRGLYKRAPVYSDWYFTLTAVRRSLPPATLQISNWMLTEKNFQRSLKTMPCQMAVYA